jgi:hypothetical protein
MWPIGRNIVRIEVEWELECLKYWFGFWIACLRLWEKWVSWMGRYVIYNSLEYWGDERERDRGLGQQVLVLKCGALAKSR